MVRGALGKFKESLHPQLGLSQHGLLEQAEVWFWGCQCPEAPVWHGHPRQPIGLEFWQQKRAARDGGAVDLAAAAVLPPAAAAQIRAALVAALEAEGGSIEYEHEPGISQELREHEAQMRAALKLLNPLIDGAAEPQ